MDLEEENKLRCLHISRFESTTGFRGMCGQSRRCSVKTTYGLKGTVLMIWKKEDGRWKMVLMIWKKKEGRWKKEYGRRKKEEGIWKIDTWKMVLMISKNLT